MGFKSNIAPKSDKTQKEPLKPMVRMSSPAGTVPATEQAPDSEPSQTNVTETAQVPPSTPQTTDTTAAPNTQTAQEPAPAPAPTPTTIATPAATPSSTSVPTQQYTPAPAATQPYTPAPAATQPYAQAPPTLAYPYATVSPQECPQYPAPTRQY
ncbi:MAG: hypothetical protein MHPSP_002801, partial [Paramarteilia canceri]